MINKLNNFQKVKHFAQDEIEDIKEDLTQLTRTGRSFWMKYHIIVLLQFARQMQLISDAELKQLKLSLESELREKLSVN